MKPAFAAFAAAICLLAGASFAPASAAAADAASARDTLRENNCFRCHAFKKEKDGPTWYKVAEKYRGRADAEERLVRHLSGKGVALFADGHEEKHRAIKPGWWNGENEIRNLVQWILSL